MKRHGAASTVSSAIRYSARRGRFRRCYMAGLQDISMRFSLSRCRRAFEERVDADDMRAGFMLSTLKMLSARDEAGWRDDRRCRAPSTRHNSKAVIILPRSAASPFRLFRSGPAFATMPRASRHRRRRQGRRRASAISPAMPDAFRRAIEFLRVCQPKNAARFSPCAMT